MSLFVASTCQVLGDVIVNHSAWSKVDQIAALSAYTVDENDRETNQVLFTNNEVRQNVKWSTLRSYTHNYIYFLGRACGEFIDHS